MEEFTTFDDIKPASTCAVDPERKVVEGNKQTYGATGGVTGGMGSHLPTISGSISGTGAKESSSTMEFKVYNPKITHSNCNGVIWWSFIVDDPNHQQSGLDLKELGKLPSVSCLFMGSSDDAPLPPAPDLFCVEVMSCWSLIPSKSNLLSSYTPLLVKPPASFSNLCQIMKLHLPSKLSKPSFYKAIAKATPDAMLKKAFEEKRPSSHRFIPSIKFSNSEEGCNVSGSYWNFKFG